MASLKPCKVCKHEVAKSAKSCPNCGAKLKMGFFKKAFLGIAGFIIVIIAIAAASSGGKSTNKPLDNAPTSATSAKPAAELSKEGISSDVKITVEGFDTKDQVGNNQFAKANAQGAFKIVKLTLTNNQKDAITIDSNSFKLVDSKGREFTDSSEAQLALESSMGDKKESFFLKKLNPGLSLTGYVVFDVPKDAEGFVLKARGGFTGKEITLKVE